LKAITGQIEQGLAASLRPLSDTLSEHDQAATRSLARDLLHLQPRHLGRLPLGVGVSAKLLHGAGQARHHDEGQARFLRGAQHALVSKPAVGPQQPDPDMGG